MQLELKAIGATPPQPSRPRWSFERGRRTLGRAPDCDWQLPEEQRSVSKLHCIIERDRDGFLLRDQSANGSRVDGVLVHEGETARLADRSRLELGALAFSVHISGERDREIEDPDGNLALSDEPLTISAILADIAPGGRTATGILGDRAADDWSEAVTDKKPGSSPSRNVDIGWSGPPEMESAVKLLPDDWNADGASAFGSHLEHGSATHVAVPVSRARHTATTLETVNDNMPRPEAMPETADEPDDVADFFAQIPQDHAGASSVRLAPLVARMEDALESAFAIFEMEQPVADSRQGFFGHAGEGDLISRTEALLARQLRLNAALEHLVKAASQAMEPRLLEARIDAGARRAWSGWGNKRDYWQAYRAQFERNGRVLSVRDIFREAMSEASHDAGGEARFASQQGGGIHEE